MGWTVIDFGGHRLISHSGGTFGVGSRLTLLPRQDISCVVLTNGASSAEGYDLWEIESAIIAALIPGLPKAPNVEAPVEEPFTPPDALVGVWKGAIKVDSQDLPASLTIDMAGKVLLEIGGQAMMPIPIKNPLGPFCTSPTRLTRRKCLKESPPPSSLTRASRCQILVPPPDAGKRPETVGVHSFFPETVGVHSLETVGVHSLSTLSLG